MAQHLSRRLRLAARQLTGAPDLSVSGRVRREHDLLGERDVPAEAYYGIQTLRAVENFPISGTRLSGLQHFIDALAMIKKAAALANHELGILERPRTEAIAVACDEILAGKLHDQFVADMIQGGAGTSTNMNANEAIANRGWSFPATRKESTGTSTRTTTSTSPSPPTTSTPPPSGWR